MAPRRASALFCAGLLAAGLGLWVLASGGSAAPSAAIELSGGPGVQQRPSPASPISLPVLNEADAAAWQTPSPRRLAKAPARTAADLDEALEVALALACAALDGDWNGRASWDQRMDSLAGSLGPVAASRLERTLADPGRSLSERLAAADLLTRLEAPILGATSLAALRSALRPGFGGSDPVDVAPPPAAAVTIHRRALVALGTAEDIDEVFRTLLGPRSAGPESPAKIAWILAAARGDGLLPALCEELRGPRAEPALLAIATWCDAAEAQDLSAFNEAGLLLALDSLGPMPESSLSPRLRQARTALDRLRTSRE